MWAQMWTAGATNKLKEWLKKDKSLKNKAEETREKIGEGECQICRRKITVMKVDSPKVSYNVLENKLC